MIKVLRHREYKRMAWKNGLGVTEEVLAYPPGSDIAAFGWRLSIAHVGTDGPFSVFPGIDRTIALLDGGGLYLDLPDRTTVELNPQSEPFAFSGDHEISSRNKSGQTIDLNIMTRRGLFEHHMRRIRSGPIAITCPVTIFLFNSPATISHPQGNIALARFDAILADREVSQLVVPQDADVLMMEITASS